jgi:uncharacterized lipoprotein YmbA
MKKRMISLLIAVAGLAVLAGCFGSTAPSRFYALTSIEQTPTGPGPKTGTADIAVGIGPVKIADYLDRSDIVTRDTGNTLEFAEFEQWAGSFEDNVTSALAENLGLLLRSEQIYAHRWPQAVPVKYQVALEVIRFDGKPGGEACQHIPVPHPPFYPHEERLRNAGNNSTPDHRLEEGKDDPHAPGNEHEQDEDPEDGVDNREFDGLVHGFTSHAVRVLASYEALIDERPDPARETT